MTYFPKVLTNRGPRGNYFILVKFIHLFWERKHELGRGRERRERESQAGFTLSARSPMRGSNREIMTWVEVRCLTDWATQVPQSSDISNFYLNILTVDFLGFYLLGIRKGAVMWLTLNFSLTSTFNSDKFYWITFKLPKAFYYHLLYTLTLIWCFHSCQDFKQNTLGICLLT